MSWTSTQERLSLTFEPPLNEDTRLAIPIRARVLTTAHVFRSYLYGRGSDNPLYRRVLARYVQMATEGGVVQALFPEGGLSRDGKLRDPKIGLLKYMLETFHPEGERDLVFIPVAVNYDRVIEDRSLLRSLDPDAEPRSRLFVIRKTLGFIRHNLWLMIRKEWYRFGYAAANFGTPISMRAYAREHGVRFDRRGGGAPIEQVQNLARDLMQAVGHAIPVLPVSLISHVFVKNPDSAFSELELKTQAQALITELEKGGAHVYIPRSDRDYALIVGLRMLTLRHLVLAGDDGLYRIDPEELPLLRYYAHAIHHLVPVDRAAVSGE